MKNKTRIFAVLGVWVLTYMCVFLGTASAAGFALYEWDNRANAMGGAVIASQNPNPSAVAYNPAGLTKLDGIQAQAGFTVFAPSSRVNAGGESVTTKDDIYLAPHAFATYQINDDFYFGVGEFSRFGLGVRYDDDWFGASNIYKAVVESFSVQPTLAWQMNDSVSVAFGVEYIMGNMDLRQEHPLTGLDMQQFPEGDAWTWVAATQIDITDTVSLGFVYRDGFRFKAEGDFKYNGVDAGKTKVAADFPSSLSSGLSYTPTQDLSFELDIIYTYWSEFEAMDFSGAVVKVSEKQYRDAVRIQLGSEYEAWENIFLRAGYVYDQSPQNMEYTDYMLPANDRHIISVGVGFKEEDWSVDASFARIQSVDYDFDNAVTGVANGQNVVDQGVTFFGGLSFNYHF